MNIKIELDKKPEEITQADYHAIRRVATVLKERGHQVEIIWPVKELKVA
jgi:hypothetical protein